MAHPSTPTRTTQDRAAPGAHRQSEGRTRSARLGAATPSSAIGLALGLAIAITLGEYLGRRVLAPSLPTIGSPTVNDMAAAALVYAVLVTLVTPPAGRSLAALGRALRGVAASATTWLPWIGGVGFLAAVLAIAPLDARLWGDVRLPSFTAPSPGPVLLADAARPLSILSLLLVNGVVIPLAEERLWRGLIQPSLRGTLGLVPALLVTAVLFSLKHVVVDASPGRLLALTAGGLVLGLVAWRAGGAAGGRTGWQTSAVSHMAGNLVATGLALAAGAL